MSLKIMLHISEESVSIQLIIKTMMRISKDKDFLKRVPGW